MADIYSDNIVFLDTEFTNLDIRKGELLSVGMVKATGEEGYMEIAYTGEVHPWVEKHVFPYLKKEFISQEEAREKIRTFVGDGYPYMMAYVNQFDAVYLYDLFQSPKEHPFFWIPIDFASILFARGYDPNSMGHHAFFEKLGIDKSVYNSHHALDDARMLKDVYYAFQKTIHTY